MFISGIRYGHDSREVFDGLLTFMGALVVTILCLLTIKEEARLLWAQHSVPWFFLTSFAWLYLKKSSCDKLFCSDFPAVTHLPSPFLLALNVPAPHENTNTVNNTLSLLITQLLSKCTLTYQQKKESSCLVYSSTFSLRLFAGTQNHAVCYATQWARIGNSNRSDPAVLVLHETTQTAL